MKKKTRKVKKKNSWTSLQFHSITTCHLFILFIYYTFFFFFFLSEWLKFRYVTLSCLILYSSLQLIGHVTRFHCSVTPHYTSLIYFLHLNTFFFFYLCNTLKRKEWKGCPLPLPSLACVRVLHTSWTNTSRNKHVHAMGFEIIERTLFATGFL